MKEATLNPTPLSDKPSAKQQQKFILAYVAAYGRITTLEARKHGIMSPASRIFELKAHGYNMVGNWVEEGDDAGIMHRIVVYTLDGDKDE